jgi:hypothetical protein
MRIATRMIMLTTMAMTTINRTPMDTVTGTLTL